MSKITEAAMDHESNCVAYCDVLGFMGNKAMTEDTFRLWLRLGVQLNPSRRGSHVEKSASRMVREAMVE